MPYKRRRLTGGRYRRRYIRRTGRGGYRRIKKFIKGVVRRMSEIKYSFASNNGVILNTVPFITDITPTFAQGASKNNRIGDSIRYKFMQFRATLTITTGAAGASNYPTLRVMVVQTRLPLSAAPSVLDVLDSNNILSSVKNQAVRTLYDRVQMYLSPGMAATNLPGGRTIKLKTRLNNNVNFANNLDVLPRDTKDKYYFLVVPHSAVVPNDYNIGFSWFNRISFTDI